MLNSDVDFNPRLREGGDGFYWSKHCKRCLISIHASAKEATFEHLLYVLDEHIFQSTPPRRRRRQDAFRARLNPWRFQSTPPRRRRQSEAVPNKKAKISIHASAKEATVNERYQRGNTGFQSTPPRRRRPALNEYGGILVDFNPRLREGGDRNIL